MRRLTKAKVRGFLTAASTKAAGKLASSPTPHSRTLTAGARSARTQGTGTTPLPSSLVGPGGSDSKGLALATFFKKKFDEVNYIATSLVHNVFLVQSAR